MRIAFLCSEYPPHRGGGIGTFTQALGRALVRAGAHVDAVGVYPVERDALEDDQGVRVWRLAAARTPYTRFVRNGWKVTRKLRELCEQDGLDLVEGQENAFAAVGPLDGVKKVIRMHGGHHFFAVTLGRQPALWRGWQERRSFRQADAVCAVSRYVAETTRHLLGLGSRQIEILPNFVDPVRFCPCETAQEEENLVVFAGTICEKKGIHFLIQAFPKVLAEQPAARLVVAGRDQADVRYGGSFRGHLERLMDETTRGRVEFAGPVPYDQMPALLGRAAVCVFPSLMEAMPMAWLEGMAMGKAVVASRLGPGPEVIRDGVEGLLCDPRQPQELASAIVRLLRDPDLRYRLGRAARRRIEEDFSAAVMVEKNLGFYRRVLAEG